MICSIFTSKAFAAGLSAWDLACHKQSPNHEHNIRACYQRLLGTGGLLSLNWHECAARDTVIVWSVCHSFVLSVILLGGSVIIRSALNSYMDSLNRTRESFQIDFS